MQTAGYVLLALPAISIVCSAKPFSKTADRFGANAASYATVDGLLHELSYFRAAVLGWCRWNFGRERRNA